MTKVSLKYGPTILLLAALFMVACSKSNEVLDEAKARVMINNYIANNWSKDQAYGFFTTELVKMEAPIIEGDKARVKMKLRKTLDTDYVGKLTHEPYNPQVKSVIYAAEAQFERDKSGQWVLTNVEEGQTEFDPNDLTERQRQLLIDSNKERLYGRFAAYIEEFARYPKDVRQNLSQHLTEFDQLSPDGKREAIKEIDKNKQPVLNGDLYWAYDSLTPEQKKAVHEELEK